MRMDRLEGVISSVEVEALDMDRVCIGGPSLFRLRLRSVSSSDVPDDEGFVEPEFLEARVAWGRVPLRA